MRNLMILTVILGLCCSCSETASDSDSTLTNVQVGSVAQQISSLVEAAVQNSVAEEGEAADGAIHARMQPSFLSQLGFMHAPSSAVAPIKTEGFSYDAVNCDFTLASSFNTNMVLDGSAYPNASGTLNIAATATAPTGSRASGAISFNPIVVTTANDVSVTDPNSGATASWADGTVFNYTVTVVWNWTDTNNWTYTTTTTSTAVDRAVTVTGLGDTHTGDVDHNFSWTRTVSRTGGNPVVVSLDAISGTRDAVWTTQSSGKVHQVHWDVTSLTDIEVTVDGFTFQFNSLLALVALLDASLEYDS